MDEHHIQRENVYAFLDDFKTIIHISKVTRETTGHGPGYFCLGCKRRLQAKLAIVSNRMSYFGHDPKAVKNQSKCNYSDETHRHILGKEILQRLKSIRVPNLYKYISDEKEPKKYLLAESKTINAVKVLNEHYIYEDENGEIQYSLNEKIAKGKELFIRPDVLFFDRFGKPILIIELVATHKPDQKKLLKLKRLGIDAVQVRVPKDSPEAIEMAFRRTENTHWIYNYVEENTTDIPISGSLVEGISELDGEQRKFFEENAACRSAQINNLIRQVERLLESERYRKIIEDFESEIQRVEKNTRSAEQRLEELRNECSERGTDQHSERRTAFNQRRDEFQRRRRDLEARYLSKKRYLDGETGIAETAIAEIKFQLTEVDARGERAGISIEEERRSIESLERRIADAIKSRERIESNLEFTQRNFDEKTREMDESLSHHRSQASGRRKRLETEYGERTATITRQVDETTIDEDELRRELSTKHPKDREEYLNWIDNESYQGDGWFATEYKKLRELDDAINVYLSSYQELLRIEKGGRN